MDPIGTGSERRAAREFRSPSAGSRPRLGRADRVTGDAHGRIAPLTLTGAPPCFGLLWLRSPPRWRRNELPRQVPSAVSADLRLRSESIQG